MEHYSVRTHQRNLEVDGMCNCKEVHLEELVYDENRWNYLPIHKKCGKYVSRTMCRIGSPFMAKPKEAKINHHIDPS